MATPKEIQNYTPKILDRWLHVDQLGYKGVVRYHSRKSFGPKVIVVHIQEGSNLGSWQHFHAVKASSTVLIGKNGDIWNLVPENRAPWTNGDVNSPDQLAIAVMNRWGWDPNTYSLTIENEGFSGSLPNTENQYKSNLWQIWQWLVKYPTIETIHIMRHGQFNSITRPRCPEPAPYRFMQRIAAAIKGEAVPQPDNPTTIYRDPWPVQDAKGKAWDGSADLTVNGIKFYADKRRVRVSVDALNCRQWASNTANLVRVPLKLGETFDVLGWVEGEEVAGERRWWITAYGTRVWSGGTYEKPSEAAPNPTKPDDGISKPDVGNERDAIPVILNGNTYFPVEQHGDTPGQTMKMLENGNVRTWAATHAYSPVQRTIKKGDTVRVSHWVRGENVTQDIGGKSVTSDKWYVIQEGSNPITKGGRIWGGMVEEVV